MPLDYPELESLAPQEKITLAAQLWEEATQTMDEEPDPELLNVLEERLEHYRQNPETGLTWEEVKKRVRNHG